MQTPFSVAWDNIGLQLIQLAVGNKVWVLDMKKIQGEHPVGGRDTGLDAKAFLTELRRILQSPDIAKGRDKTDERHQHHLG